MITIYIDVLFLVNFIINILIIEGCGVIMSEETKWYRTVLSALCGACYAVLIFFPNLGYVQSVFMKILISGIMVKISFRTSSIKHFVKLWGSFYIVSFIFGGSIVALMSMTNLGAKTGAVFSNGAFYFNLPWRIFFFGAAVTYFFIELFARVRKRKIAKESVKRKLSIYFLGKCVETKGIIDTGNSLFDPITGVPVIVCEYDAIKDVINKSDGEALLDKMNSLGIRIRLIPFKTVGTNSGLMLAFMPEKVKIDNYEAKRCLVGISETKLTKNDDYHALLNPNVIIK